MSKKSKMPMRRGNNMQITPNEIDAIEEAGILDHAPVKLIRTKGGFWIAVGKPRGKQKDEALAAGSHPAIVKYNLEKQYPGFQPSMMKSEHFSDSTIVEKHSHFLSQELRKSGHDIYSIQDGNVINFHITKLGINVASVNSVLKDNSIVIKDLSVDKAFARALAGATTEKAISCGVSKIKVEG